MTTKQKVLLCSIGGGGVALLVLVCVLMASRRARMKKRICMLTDAQLEQYVTRVAPGSKTHGLALDEMGRRNLVKEQEARSREAAAQRQRDQEQAAARAKAQQQQAAARAKAQRELKDKLAKNKRLWTEFTTDQASYYDKDVELIGVINVSDYYNYYFSGKEETCYSFELSSGEFLGQRIHVYTMKTEFGKGLRTRILDKGGKDVAGLFTVNSLSKKNDGCVWLTAYMLYE